MLIVPQSVELLWCTPDPLRQIEKAGRTCYRSDDRICDGSAEIFVRNILRRGHLSVIEHGSASFLITTDRGISHQIVRHRLASYSQESTRYCNYSRDRFNGEIGFVKPLGLEEDSPAYTCWKQACETAETSYLELIRLGQSPQVARDVLPTCTKTEFVMTCNFREWLHFLKERESNAAHPKVVKLAQAIRVELSSLVPVVFENDTSVYGD